MAEISIRSLLKSARLSIIVREIRLQSYGRTATPAATLNPIGCFKQASHPNTVREAAYNSQQPSLFSRLLAASMCGFANDILLFRCRKLSAQSHLEPPKRTTWWLSGNSLVQNP
ncbi:uncharacterized protein MEPE_02312 [Melanopsichium pennsylvanicum]|uniref:Uncharacterized protein n=1 Tax=Melanopsichium pennsylvanicum TaxID=63383 RepID=A0AAJ4XK28_9BASI|nr:uncharacterized protein MEPE_02312 [Melanopsichium pennsylvanicum]